MGIHPVHFLTTTNEEYLPSCGIWVMPLSESVYETTLRVGFNVDVLAAHLEGVDRILVALDGLSPLLKLFPIVWIKVHLNAVEARLQLVFEFLIIQGFDRAVQGI